MTEAKNRYAAAGVDVTAGYEAVKRMGKHIERTKRAGVLAGLGGFGGLFELPKGYQEPVLVSGTDGVGTKILLAQEAGILDQIGIDCVAMCANDVLAQGAEPLFFLDYLAVGKNYPEKIEALVKGVAEGCVQAKAALIGGETAEMPDVYAADEFDLAGFCVGIAEKSQLLLPEKVVAGDVLIGVPSSGVHSNGFSLVRDVLFKEGKVDKEATLPSGKSLLETLLTPTRIYVKEVLPLIQRGLVHGIAHITGGGFVENVPRILPEGLLADLTLDPIETPEIFTYIQSIGSIPDDQMYQVFNMGIGLILAVPAEKEQEVLAGIPDSLVLGRVEVKEQAQDLPIRLRQEGKILSCE